MFQNSRSDTRLGSAATVLELIYHNTVRNLRKSHGNALVALGLNMSQTVIFVLTFYAMFSLLGLRGNAIRGDFLLYIMSGIFLFMVHVKTMAAILQSEGPASPMMKHAPMNTAIAIGSAALGSLYIQILTVVVILFVYHVGWGPLVIHNWVGALAMLLLSWLTGLGVGLCFLALKPWAPTAVQVASTVFSRANMIGSGKMFVANTMPGYLLPFFVWNPLFHTIDQARGYVFINYFPHHTSPTYPLWVGLGLIMVGLMGEFYTRRHASLSWSARR